ncbi:MAG: hypothetical protein ACLS89_04920 [Collinsella sp.]
MDIARLDNLLLELTDSERAYRAGARYDWCDAFDWDFQPEIDDNHVHKIGNRMRALHQKGMPEGLSIVRNSRFNPVPEHVHDYVEISYVYCGNAPQIVNGAQLTLAQNEVLLLDAACPHAIGELGEHDIMLSIVISRPMLRRSLDQTFRPRYCLAISTPSMTKPTTAVTCISARVAAVACAGTCRRCSANSWSRQRRVLRLPRGCSSCCWSSLCKATRPRCCKRTRPHFPRRRLRRR